MKVLLLAGGFGTRLSEETDIRPKPMVEIGGKPILWHIMKIYSKYGFNDFVILLGYKGYYIKEYFANYFLHQSDVTIDMQTGKMEVLNNSSEPWKITLLDTGLDSMTGGRIKKAQSYIGNEPFMLTYGDGVSDVNIEKLVDSHAKSGKLVTLTSIQPLGRWGALDIARDCTINSFIEKPVGDGTWINGGFFVCENKALDYIKPNDNSVIWERDPLQNLAKDGQLHAYKHEGFWHPMDMLKDKTELTELWTSEKAPWKVWNSRGF